MTAELPFALRGIGLLGPGFTDWQHGRELLAEPLHWLPARTVLPAPMRLPAAERRRAGAIVKLSLAVADQACAQAGIDPLPLATVFASSTSDAANCHALCEALAQPERIVSPTRFTNSVHNAAAGYWHIATTSRAPSTTVCAFDASFGAGLLEAATQCIAWQRPVLFVAADVPYPQPLHAVRPLADAFGVALLIDSSRDAPSLARLSVCLTDAATSDCRHAGLDALRTATPAARSLPLLAALARNEPARTVIEMLDGAALQLDVTPS